MYDNNKQFRAYLAYTWHIIYKIYNFPIYEMQLNAIGLTERLICC